MKILLIFLYIFIVENTRYFHDKIKSYSELCNFLQPEGTALYFVADVDTIRIIRESKTSFANIILR